MAKQTSKIDRRFKPEEIKTVRLNTTVERQIREAIEKIADEEFDGNLSEVAEIALRDYLQKRNVPLKKRSDHSGS